MTVKAGYATPIYHVAEITKSLEFYERLGFTTVFIDDCKPPSYARMECSGGAIAFLAAEKDHPVNPAAQGVLLYMYTPDLAGLHAQLIASGVTVSGIGYPGYMPRGEFNLLDPDGYRLCVGHWGKEEQENWEKAIGRKPQ